MRRVALVVLLLWPAFATSARAQDLTVSADSDTLEVIEIKQNAWLAAGEAAGINVLIWSFNRFIREGGTNPGFRIGFNSWEENIKNGFEWDDNSFSTNQFAHPYHGSLYFNAARSNGFDYWTSLTFSMGGSLMWEYLMETHHASFNDWIATGVGGAALGESLHRLSTMLWDNTATGSERFWREIGGFAVNPMGGFNRLLRGETSKVYANPGERFPRAFYTNLEVGTRSIGEDRVYESDTTRVFVRAGFAYGNPFEGDVKKPFDSFDFLIQVNFGDKTGVGQANAKGLLFAAPLAEDGESKHLIAAYQHYDYINNNAYEFGGQSVSASYLSQIKTSRATLVTSFHADGVILGGTKSDYEDFTGRSYSYGPGVGFKFSTTLLRKGRPFFSLGHSSHWIWAINGDAATHNVNATNIRLNLPLGEVFGVGAEYILYYAEREYRDFPDVTQRNPELRFFANWITF